MRNPDKREWVQFNRELEERSQQLQQCQRNLQKVTLDRNASQSECRQLNERLKLIEANLNQINEVYMPRLHDVERLHAELDKEIKHIRQDAELLPSMFRNEVYMKKKIRDEKIDTEERMNQALKDLVEKKETTAVLKEQLSRKEKIAIHAIAARNSLE